MIECIPAYSLSPNDKTVLIFDENTSSWTLYVSDIDGEDRSVTKLFEWFQQIKQIQALPLEKLDFVVDFRYCQFINHVGVAFLGGLARWIESHGGRIQFDWNTLTPKIQMNLGQSGFLESFGVTIGSWEGNSIPYRCDLTHHEQAIGQYLRDDWLGRGWVNVSPGVRDTIAGQTAEIYLNAFEHSQSPIGVFSCGQHYPKQGRLELTVIDFGIGIPDNVRSLPQNCWMTSSEAIDWAFQDGTSTKDETIGRGVGLNLLQSFVSSNQGDLRVFSGDGCAIIKDNEGRYKDKCTSFQGTLVNIVLLCDEFYYCLPSEVSQKGRSWF
jgi:hypothetical protein